MSTRSRVGQIILFSLGFLCVAPLGVSARPQINTHLALGGDLWDNPFSSDFSFDDDFRLSSMRTRMSAFGVQTETGDISANWDQLGLAGRSFQGIKMGVPVGKANVELLRGNVVLPPDIFKPRDLLDETPPAAVISSLYGLRATLPLSSSLSLSGAQLFTPDASQSQGKSINTLALNYQKGQNERVNLEVARSERGAAWQVSGATQRGRLKVQGSFRQTALGFSTAGNPSLQTRRNGGTLNLSYRIAPTLSLNASTQRYNDGRIGRLSSDTLSLRFAKRNKPTVNLFWRSASTLRSPTTNRTQSSTSFEGVGLRVDHKLGVNRVSLQFNHNDYKSSGDLAGNVIDRLGVTWSRPLNRQTQMSLTQIVDLRRDSDTDTDTTRSLYTLLNVQHRVGKTGLRLDTGIEYSNRHSSEGSGQSAAIRAGVNYQMRSGNAIGVQYRTRLSGSGTLSASSPDQLYLSYAHRFGSNSLRSRLPLQERRQLGKVMGRVFEDSNGNGKWDDGEVGVSDVTVQARGNSTQQTDRSGAFLLSDLRAGDYHLQLVGKTLPIELTTMTPTEIKVSVPAGKAALVEFPVSRTGKATGSVFRDENRNGIRDKAEEGVSNVVVQAMGSDVIAFTDAEGHYELHGLPPRNWKVSVNVEAIGEDYENTGSGFVEVAVSPNGSVSAAPLGIAPKERAVIKGFEKSISE